SAHCRTHGCQNTHQHIVHGVQGDVERGVIEHIADNLKSIRPTDVRIRRDGKRNRLTWENDIWLT
ncbi:MAG: hypothetical protein ACTSPX_04550, partial [Candidatus Thorarchaeota archaeon]